MFDWKIKSLTPAKGMNYLPLCLMCVWGQTVWSSLIGLNPSGSFMLLSGMRNTRLTLITLMVEFYKFNQGIPTLIKKLVRSVKGRMTFGQFIGILNIWSNFLLSDVPLHRLRVAVECENLFQRNSWSCESWVQLERRWKDCEIEENNLCWSEKRRNQCTRGVCKRRSHANARSVGH